jgi:hypothetical protein
MRFLCTRIAFADLRGYLLFPPNSRYIPGRGALPAGIPGSVAGKRLAKEYL